VLVTMEGIGVSCTFHVHGKVVLKRQVSIESTRQDIAAKYLDNG
jgi:hypothetical protein